MRQVHVVMEQETDWHWNGEDSIPVTTEYPALIFATAAQADAWVNAHAECAQRTYCVNLYEEGESP